MKKAATISVLASLAIFSITFQACKKENPQVPTVTTRTISAITTTSATSGGTVISDGGAAVTERGVAWSTSHDPTVDLNSTSDGTGSGTFLSEMNGLTGGTAYYVRAYATNSAGTGYGNEVLFLTKEIALATVLTSPASLVTATAAVAGGIVNNDGGDEITARGICWSSTDQNPIKGVNITSDGTGIGTFSSTITNLTPNTTYYIRAYATNSAGTAYGASESFTTPKLENTYIVFNPNLTYGIVTDVEGNIYRTIQIGGQTWTAENLKSTKYNDGVAIDYVPGGIEWSSNYDAPEYCWYNSSPAIYMDTYGALYNWPVVESGKICPTGWHVFTKEELDVLMNYLGGEAEAGSKLKEIGFIHWEAPNTGATNSSGWTALPGGHRNGNGIFSDINNKGYWWSSKADTYGDATYLELAKDSPYVSVLSGDMRNGLSIRCVKN